ncbi:hypothetical protein EVAR_23967_1 [Eumeta japonica]|uniref:non-specific serine/threonine protein kinase n=1 Tax=Eumeta variegata TaxID=151549 RepID=A0A4C1V2V9_EUMVA|nr:hypothetical protein EVAR_23967_1 [Eumeta japonica]
MRTATVHPVLPGPHVACRTAVNRYPAAHPPVCAWSTRGFRGLARALGIIRAPHVLGQTVRRAVRGRRLDKYFEIEQESKRHATSPTNKLMLRWGQLNHRVEELFVLLYKMKHVPAMRCLESKVGTRFQRLLLKLNVSNASNGNKDTAPIDDNGNKTRPNKTGSESYLPLPVMLMEEGVVLPTSTKEDNNINDQSEVSSTENNTCSTNGPKGDLKDNEFMKNISAIPMLKYDELKEATNNWSESNLLGRGGFGQVFKGEWKLLPIAVKRLRGVDGKELIRELCLNQYRHDNILPLYGYSLGGPEACLVYQLMTGGSLEQRLRRSRHPPLTWCQRYRIAHGVARGLQYLHRMAGTPLIHGDIKPANILLDQCTMPKIGDFGLARKGPYGEDRTHMKVSRVHGTRPYLPDEYLRSRCLSPAVDVFSYGVVLLETATALPAMDKNRDSQLLYDHVHMVAHRGDDVGELEDPILKRMQNSNPELCRSIIAIGINCTKYARQERPSMLEIYQALDKMEFQGKNEHILARVN